MRVAEGKRKGDRSGTDMHGATANEEAGHGPGAEEGRMEDPKRTS